MKKLFNKTLIVILSLIMVFSSVFVISAASKNGKGGTAYAGAETNDFAAEMPLSEIYFVAEKFFTDPDTIEITEGEGTILQIDDEKEVQILAAALVHNHETNDFDTATKNAKYKSTYKDAAILPDGSKKDVVIEFEVTKVMTAKAPKNSESTDDVEIPETTTIHNNHTNDKGVNLVVSTPGGTGITNTYFGISVEQKITINVDGTGDFVVPFYGFNQNRNNSGSYTALRKVHGSTKGEDGYEGSIETLIIDDSDYIYYPDDTDSYRTVDNGNFIQRGGTEELYNANSGGGAGGDGDGYRSGFATIGQNGFTATSISACGEDKSKSYGNNEYIALGDLIHRIWSGSGPNGKIETGKQGTGTDLPGGSFPDDIPEGRPEGVDDLKRYVVPDGKTNVTYTMTPDDGYFADKVSVDGETKKIPMDQPVGTTWTFAAGILKHEGNDVYTFTFTNPNAEDHNVYVTWRTTPAADDVVSFGPRGETQTGTPIFKPAEGKSFNSGDFILIDENGDEVDSITVPGEGKYTINKETGEVTFVPEPDFVGPARGVTVRGTQDDGQTVTATYTPTVVDNEQTVTKTQNITYYYDDGTPVLDDNGNPLVETRTHTYTRKGTVNPLTGEVTWDEWTSKDFDDVISPDIDGYLPDKDKVDGGSFTPDNWPEDEKVVYSKAETIWVTYIDEDGTVYKEKTKFRKDGEEPSGPSNPKKTGYDFIGWDRHVDEQGNITYIAKWKKVNRRVIVNTSAK